VVSDERDLCPNCGAEVSAIEGSRIGQGSPPQEEVGECPDCGERVKRVPGDPWHLIVPREQA
jgi:hypothetical protein